MGIVPLHHTGENRKQHQFKHTARNRPFPRSWMHTISMPITPRAPHQDNSSPIQLTSSRSLGKWPHARAQHTIVHTRKHMHNTTLMCKPQNSLGMMRMIPIPAWPSPVIHIHCTIEGTCIQHNQSQTPPHMLAAEARNSTELFMLMWHRTGKARRRRQVGQRHLFISHTSVDIEPRQMPATNVERQCLVNEQKPQMRLGDVQAQHHDS